METRYLNEEVKLRISVTPVDGMNLDGFDWEVWLWTKPTKILKIQKGMCIPQDDGSYIIPFNTGNVGVGAMKLRIVACIPDGDFADGDRTSIAEDVVLTIINGYAK